MRIKSKYNISKLQYSNTNSCPFTLSPHLLNKKRFELSNHLGNVLPVPQNLQFCGIKLHLTNVCIYYALETLY